MSDREGSDNDRSKSRSPCSKSSKGSTRSSRSAITCRSRRRRRKKPRNSSKRNGRWKKSTNNPRKRNGSRKSSSRSSSRKKRDGKSCGKKSRHSSQPSRKDNNETNDDQNMSTNLHKVEVLEKPTKSPVDKMAYRAIKLENGLHALLISDENGSSGDSDEEDDFNCVDVRIGKFNKEVLGLEKEVCCQCGPRLVQTKSKESKRPQSNKKVKKRTRGDPCGESLLETAAVSLCVGAGSFDEPDDIPGLAHLTEHAIFLGSRKYPDKYAFDSLLSANDGSSNGTTYGEETVFTFSVNCEKLIESLEMFVESLKEPLLRTVDIIQERDTVVDAEFEDKKSIDSLQRLQLLQMTGKKGHPVTRFTFGNKHTLQTKDKNNETLAERVREFFREQYTVDKMSLVIEAPINLDNLQNLVLKFFGPMKSSGKPFVERFSSLPLLLRQPYDTPQFRKCYKVVLPKNDSNQLIVTWAFPPEARLNYRVKPLKIVGFLLSTECVGGLGDYLRKRYWLKSVEAGPGETETECNGAVVLFTITFTLTKTGLQNTERILGALFSYIRFTIQQGLQEWFCTEHQHLSALEMHFTNNDALDEYEYCKTLSLNLRRFGFKDVLGGGILIYDWDPQVVDMYLRLLRPENANYMIISKHFEKCDKIEPYFGTKYEVKDIAPAFLKQLQSINLNVCFQPLKPNPFITKNFCPVYNPEADDQDELNREEERIGPHCVVDTEYCELWHRLDLELAAESIYMFELISPLPLRTSHMTAMLDLWIYILGWNLKPLEVTANISKLNFKISRSYRGVFIEVEGLSQKLKLLLDCILEHISKMHVETSCDSFELGKHGQLKEYETLLLSPTDLASSLKGALTSDFYWIENDLYEALKTITFDMFKAFCHEFISELFILGLMQGNVADSGVTQLRNDFKRILQFEPIIWKPLPTRRGMQLPLGETIARVQSLTAKDNIACIIQTYQIGVATMEEHAIAILLSGLMAEPAFQELRAKQGLGYQVDVSCDLFNEALPPNNVLEISITVETHSNEFKANYVKKKIDEFVNDFYLNTVKRMKDEEFQDLVEQFGFIDDSPDRNWDEIRFVSYKFDRYVVEAEILEDLDSDAVKSFYERYLLPGKGSQLRKLCIQVVGEADKEFPVQNLDCKVHRNGGDSHSYSPTDVSSPCCKRSARKEASEYPLIFLSPKINDNDSNGEEDYSHSCIVEHLDCFKSRLFKYEKSIHEN